MKLYAGTTEQFRADARVHRIAENAACRVHDPVDFIDRAALTDHGHGRGVRQ